MPMARPVPGPTSAGRQAASPGRRALVAFAVLGALMGSLAAAVGYTAHYASATSYLSDDPAACINCHVMNEHYDAWQRGPHHAVAHCNDCHVPHDSLLSKYMVKAEHGYRHSKGFTFQDFHEPIQLTAGSRAVVIENCVRCHDAMTHEIRLSAGGGATPSASADLDCISCHSSVAHGPTR